MPTLKIVATSDLHGDLPDPKIMPAGDVLVLAGDILPDDYRPLNNDLIVGSSRVMRQGFWFEEVFIPWLHEVKHIRPEGEHEWTKRYKHVVIVGGNHDFFFNAMLINGIQKRLPKNVTYLSETSEIIEGFKFWGAGWNMTKGWAFAHDEETHLEKLRYVPDDIDVMVVHGPPYIKEIDELKAHWCSKILRDWVHARPVKAYICGHIHEAYGQYDLGGTPIYVVSRKNRKYQDVNKFVEIEISKPDKLMSGDLTGPLQFAI